MTINIEGMYFFQFSTGFYVSDHAILKDEWEAHCKAHHEESSNLWTSIDRLDYVPVFNDKMQAYRDFIKLSPEKTFIAMHNMLPVECLEMWKDVY